MSTKLVQKLDRVVIRFAGDSGDGMQLTGDRFTTQTASCGNDLSTLPNFPAEIRAPQGTLPGVSSFQLHFADHDVLTPGRRAGRAGRDEPGGPQGQPRATSPAARRSSSTPTSSPSATSPRSGTPRTRSRTARWRATTCIPVALDLDHRRGAGVVRRTDPQGEGAGEEHVRPRPALLAVHPADRGHRGVPQGQVRRKPDILEANLAALHAGFNYGETTEDFAVSYEVARPDAAGDLPQRHRQRRARPRPGRRRAPGRPAAVPRVLPDHPGLRHPAHPGRPQAVRRATIQAEDEIAGVGAALGASFGGALGVTTTSGPGLALKAETIGLAVSLELPLVVVDIQRGGPSTGLPTKTEQADLLQAMFGRNGESPVPIVAPATPGRLLRHRRGGGAHRDDLPHAGHRAVRRLPRQRLRAVAAARAGELPDLPSSSRPSPTATRRGRRSSTRTCATPETLARPWAIPGTPGLEHRIGGIEKADVTGNISYDPDNHDHMARLRQAKIDGIAATIPARGRRPDRRRPGARARLGLDLRSDRRRRCASPGTAVARRPGPPAPPQPVPGQHRRRAAPLRARHRARDEPRPAAMLLRAEYLVDASRTRRCAACRSRRSSLADVITQKAVKEPPNDRIDLGSDYDARRGQAPRVRHLPATPRRRPSAGLHLRPGGPLVPRLRRLRDPRRRAGLPARARPQAREHRLRLGHRLLVAVPVLPRHLRHALDPRPRPGDRHRPGRDRARPVGLGRHRRRRRACRSAATTSSTRCAATSTSRSCCSTTRSTA